MAPAIWVSSEEISVVTASIFAWTLGPRWPSRLSMVCDRWRSEVGVGVGIGNLDRLRCVRGRRSDLHDRRLTYLAHRNLGGGAELGLDDCLDRGAGDDLHLGLDIARRQRLGGAGLIEHRQGARGRRDQQLRRRLVHRGLGEAHTQRRDHHHRRGEPYHPFPPANDADIAAKIGIARPILARHRADLRSTPPLRPWVLPGVESLSVRHPRRVWAGIVLGGVVLGVAVAGLPNHRADAPLKVVPTTTTLVAPTSVP